ncbi:MAG TPA: efflux RND transporter periplasmic adaptor subunit [Thermoanaerobaculia bacterium]|nr:efflux RND transporter periplasmic adaptor subunit [Thermoanaerobaculia bacterium]
MPRLAGVLFLLGIGAAIPACRRATSPPEAARAAVPVPVAAVRETRGGARSVPGVVAAKERAEIASRSSAEVLRVLVTEGSRVRRGERLAELDARELSARIDAARAALTAAAAEKSRTDRLAATGAATAREKEIADSGEAAARASLAEAEAAGPYLHVEAPFSGTVAAVPIHAGDRVSPGQPLLVVESDAGFEAQASVEADAAGRLRPGTPVAVRVDGILATLPGTVRAVSPSGDPQTHRFLVRADLPRDERLKSGLFAALEIPDPAAPARRLVPASAIVERGGLTGVFVVAAGRATLRWIDAGPREGGDVAVRAGLAPGETVALAPEGLTDGAPVEAVPR